MQKKSKNKKLIDIYLSFYLNKISIVIFMISIVLLALVFFNASSYGFSESTYLREYDNIHQSYFNESFFALGIISALFSIFLGTLEGASGVSKMDAIIVCNKKRSLVLFYKIMSFLIINWLFFIIVLLILYFIPTMLYSKFVLNKEHIIIILNMLLFGSFLTLLSMAVSLVIPNYFSSLLLFILFFLCKIFGQNNDENIKMAANLIIPQMILNEDLSMDYMFGSIYVINLLLFIYIFLNLLYKKKSLRTY